MVLGAKATVTADSEIKSQKSFKTAKIYQLFTCYILQNVTWYFILHCNTCYIVLHVTGNVPNFPNVGEGVPPIW